MGTIHHWLFVVGYSSSFSDKAGSHVGDATQANEIEDQLIDFADRAIKVADALP